MEKEEQDSGEESEVVTNSAQSKRTITTKFIIEKIFTNKNTSEMASFALTGKNRLAIYNCYDDTMGNVETSLQWEYEYTFDADMRGMGTLLYLDFDHNNVNIVASTVIGWILILNLSTKKMENKF